MDQVTTKLKRRYAAGGLLCICAALMISFFAILDIHKVAYDVLELLYRRVWLFIELIIEHGGIPHYMSSSELIYYVLDFLADASRYGIVIGIEAFELISAGVLAFMGLLVTMKVRTRALVILPIMQIITAVIVAILCLVPFLINVSVWVFTLVVVRAPITWYSLLARPIFVLLDSDISDMLYPLAMALCWFVFGIFTLIFAGGKKRRGKGTWIIPSTLVALTFGAAPLLKPVITVIDVATKLGYTFIMKVLGMLLNGASPSISTTDIINVIGWTLKTLEDSAEGVFVGIAMALCTFFIMKWFVDPFVKEK